MYLVNKLTAVVIAGRENLCPKLGLTTLDEVTRLLLEHRVLVRNRDELLVTEALGIRDVSQVRVACLAELADN